MYKAVYKSPPFQTEYSGSHYASCQISWQSDTLLIWIICQSLSWCRLHASHRLFRLRNLKPPATAGSQIQENRSLNYYRYSPDRVQLAASQWKKTYEKNMGLIASVSHWVASSTPRFSTNLALSIALCPLPPESGIVPPPFWTPQPLPAAAQLEDPAGTD